MYCNSCLRQIPKDEITYCEECGAPLHIKCANHCIDCEKELCDTCYSENHFRCSECFDINKPFKFIRRSYIKQYEVCPHSLYLQLVEGLDPPMSKYAQLGIICHSIFEDIQYGRLNESSALIRLDNEIEDWNIKNKDEYSIISLDLSEVGFRCIRNFFTVLPELKGTFELEKKIQYSINDSLPDITCTLDRISFVDDEIHIHDWKTGKPMSGKKLVEDLQPPLYIHAVYKEYGKLPESFTLHYLNSLKTLTYKKVSDYNYLVKTTRKEYILDIPEALERTERILEGINKQKFPIPKSKKVAWYCDKMCWYGISGTCQKRESEEWHKLAEEYEKETE